MLIGSKKGLMTPIDILKKFKGNMRGRKQISNLVREQRRDGTIAEKGTKGDLEGAKKSGVDISICQSRGDIENMITSRFSIKGGKQKTSSSKSKRTSYRSSYKSSVRSSLRKKSNFSRVSARKSSNFSKISGRKSSNFMRNSRLSNLKPREDANLKLFDKISELSEYDNLNI